jgi:hypothetical protein
MMKYHRLPLPLGLFWGSVRTGESQGCEMGAGITKRKQRSELARGGEGDGGRMRSNRDGSWQEEQKHPHRRYHRSWNTGWE